MRKGPPAFAKALRKHCADPLSTRSRYFTSKQHNFGRYRDYESRRSWDLKTVERPL